MSCNLLKAVLGGIGIYQPEKLKYKKTDFEKFAKDLPGPSLIFETDRTPAFFGRGIGAVTGSSIHHVENYIGEPWAKKIREKYPELMGERRFVWRNFDIKLNRIPEKVLEHEMIGSDIHIRTKSLVKLNNDDTQLSAIIFPLTEEQKEQAVFRAYLMHGMPYDIQEIASKVIGLPNPEGGKIITSKGEYDAGLKVCSSYGAFVFGINELDHTPSSLYKKVKGMEQVERKFNID